MDKITTGEVLGLILLALTATQRVRCYLGHKATFVYCPGFPRSSRTLAYVEVTGAAYMGVRQGLGVTRSRSDLAIVQAVWDISKR